MKISIGARCDSARASGNGISLSTGTKHPEDGSLAAWASRAGDSAPLLPLLPAFAEVVLLDREVAFRELGYSFWNRELVDALAARMGLEPGDWLELAAGTGRLTAELARQGISIAATDDHSQCPERVRGAERTIEYGDWVAPLSARAAVECFRPRQVLCAWPPFGSGLVLDLLAGALPGSQGIVVLLCIGEPGGATEMPLHPHELPSGWALDEWPECERYLIGFNDPPPGLGWRSYSRLLVYHRA